MSHRLHERAECLVVDVVQQRKVLVEDLSQQSRGADAGAHVRLEVREELRDVNLARHVAGDRFPQQEVCERQEAAHPAAKRLRRCRRRRRERRRLAPVLAAARPTRERSKGALIEVDGLAHLERLRRVREPHALRDEIQNPLVS